MLEKNGCAAFDDEMELSSSEEYEAGISLARLLRRVAIVCICPDGFPAYSPKAANTWGNTSLSTSCAHKKSRCS